MKPFLRSLVNGLIWIGTSLLCRIDKSELVKVPQGGPLLLVSNHINSLEVPLLFVHLQPRKLVGLAKIETWDNKFMGWLFDLWDAIPLRRGEADLAALRRSLDYLRQGYIVAIAPEGTRSYHGRLLRAQPGVVFLALRSGAPILPLAHWGGEKFSRNWRRLRRTDFHVRVGRPFVLESNGCEMTAEIRQAMADEVMRELAALLPEEYRGEYRDIERPRLYVRYLE
ncbi:MAG: 1-acyl-sn-glycerol-3-phosphate acyltransferase [Anaerolineales bacterium]|nr:1-acyl-sn-glycerol-3-phosphate acyltransferase [Anaerolineales bacterium]MCX7609583.1 1-acyl-sn-glycerol-3-phosphate acyltransferase [Anaerolineales bacterium]